MNIELNHEWSVPVHCTCTVYDYNYFLTKLTSLSHQSQRHEWSVTPSDHCLLEEKKYILNKLESGCRLLIGENSCKEEASPEIWLLWFWLLVDCHDGFSACLQTLCKLSTEL